VWGHDHGILGEACVYGPAFAGLPGVYVSDPETEKVWVIVHKRRSVFAVGFVSG
jgi:hypothetical protein